tara:strand:+ start:238 stop:516 length:279 start_codon:yes stop_codon:yes gene_type:complete
LGLFFGGGCRAIKIPKLITKREDFLRRRSKISLVVRQGDLLYAKGLKEACEILFGSEAEEKIQEYINSVFCQILHDIISFVVGLIAFLAVEI